jgi:hypothetical protein
MMRLLIVAVFLLATLTGCAKGSSEVQPSLCTPGENIFCRCDGGDAGTKRCTESGQAFEACICDSGWGSSSDDDDGSSSYNPGTGASTPEGGAGGAGGSDAPSGTGGGGTVTDPVAPTLAMFAACKVDGECISGSCQQGYCTTTCTTVSDCAWPAAECVPNGGTTVCMPRCESALGCGKYDSSQCGHTRAIDNWHVKVCANWADAHQLMPNGTDCLPYDHKACNLGYQQRGSVCTEQGVCASGCYLDTDCPAGNTCSGNGSLGKCNTAAP